MTLTPIPTVTTTTSNPSPPDIASGFDAYLKAHGETVATAKTTGLIGRLRAALKRLFGKL